MKPNPLVLSHHLILPLAIFLSRMVESAGDKKQKTPAANSAGVRKSFSAPHTPQLSRRIESRRPGVKEFVSRIFFRAAIPVLVYLSALRNHSLSPREVAWIV